METLASAPPTNGSLAERIKQLLGQNLPGSVVASAVGCDPSYVSQLLQDEDFKTEVLLMRASKAEASVARDTKWNAIEDMALDKAAQMLPLVSRPADLIRLAAMANAAKRRSVEYSGASENNAPIVNIVLPAAGAVHFQMNVNSQVVEVDGRSMAALPTKNLVGMLSEKKKIRDLQGTMEVEMPTLAPPTTVERSERKKAITILEKIGYSEEPVLVPKVM